jgi:hypothetical protein
MDINKIYISKKEKRTCIPKKNSIFYTSWLQIHFLRNFFVGYAYANFQFSKHNKYAQRICMPKFSIIFLLKKNLVKVWSSLLEQNQHEQNSKQSNEHE